MIIFAGIFLVAGLMLFNTHQTIAIILFVLSGLNFLGFTAWEIYEKIFSRVTIETSDGEVEIKNSECSKYEEYIKNMDIEKIDEILDKYPALIYDKIFYKVYYKIGENGKKDTLLFYGLYHCNVDMMQCALKHGEKFNDPELNINDNFLCRFFGYRNGDTTDEIIDTVRFALEHGVKVTNENWDLYDEAKEWVMNDGVVSEKDKELLSLLSNK